jgi:hypothetical protein
MPKVVYIPLEEECYSQVSLRNGKEKYSLSCLVQWEIYMVKAGNKRREGRSFDGLITAHYISRH